MSIPFQEEAAQRSPEQSLVLENHRAHHVFLHQNLDELWADYIRHHKDVRMDKVTVGELIRWSHQQTIKPTEKS